jgi:hypothetical protein
VSLLEELQRTHSLSAAAKSLGMSYRRAWVLLQSMNGLFDGPLALTSKGGTVAEAAHRWTERGQENRGRLPACRRASFARGLAGVPFLHDSEHRTAAAGEGEADQ